MPRILLVPFATLSLWIGLAYALGTPERTQGPTYGPAKAIVPSWVPGYPMVAWGAVFLLGFAVLAWGIVAPPAVTGATLFIGGGIYIWWATLLLIAFFSDAHASGSAPGLYAFVGFAHYMACWRVYLERKGLVT